jgi:hypothetical protein
LVTLQNVAIFRIGLALVYFFRVLAYFTGVIGAVLSPRAIGAP